MHEDSPIEKLDSSIYNGQLLVSTCDVVCVGNVIFFYLDEDDKLDIHVLVKKKTPCSKKIFIGFFH